MIPLTKQCRATQSCYRQECLLLQTRFSQGWAFITTGQIKRTDEHTLSFMLKIFFSLKRSELA